MAENTINNLPWIFVNIDMTLNDQQMKKKLMDIFQLMGGYPIEDSISINSFTIIKKDTNFIKNFCSILFNKNPSNPKIRVSIRFQENKYDRLVEIRTIEGYHLQSEATITSYLKKCIPFSKSIKIVRTSPNDFEFIEEELQRSYMDYINNEGKNMKSSNIISINVSSKKSHNTNNVILNSEPNENDSINTSRNSNNFKGENSNALEKINKQANNVYEIYKILSQENYEIGKNVTVFINEFKIKNEIIEKTYMLLPEQMKEIIHMRNICDDIFSNYFNMGKSFRLNEETAKQSRNAIDNFIFNKLYFQLYELYNRKYKEENDIFLSKKKLITEKYSIKEIMDQLEIKPQFRCMSAYEKSNHSSLCLPFKSTIDYINKIEYEQNPHSKFNTLIEAGLELRNTVLMSDGKNEVSSMDEELPIFIYITTQLNIKNAVAEYHMIEDYIKYSSMNIEESKVLLNVMGAVVYISKDWELKEKNGEKKDKEGSAKKSEE